MPIKRNQWILRGVGDSEPEPKKITLWLGSTINVTSPYCATCGEWFRPTVPYVVVVDSLHHGICHGCATKLTPVLATFAAMAEQSPAKLRRKVAETTGQPIGVIPICEAMIEEPIIKDAVLEEPIEPEVEYIIDESSIVVEEEKEPT